MSDDTLTLDEVFESTGLAAIWEARGEARAEKRNAIKIAQNMVNLGVPFDIVVSATSLDPSEVKKMYIFKE